MTWPVDRAAPAPKTAEVVGHHAPHARRFAVGEAEECAIGSYVRFDDYETLRRQYDATAKGYLAALLAARQEADRVRDVHLRRHRRLAAALGLDDGYSVDATIGEAIRRAALAATPEPR